MNFDVYLIISSFISLSNILLFSVYISGTTFDTFIPDFFFFFVVPYGLRDLSSHPRALSSESMES